jgi:nitrogen fixation NifU-like protein
MDYSDKVLEHFYSPRNVGTLPDANGIGEAGDANCGDIMKIYLKINRDMIEDVRFMTFGCGSAIASSSIATELIKGKTLEEAWNLTNKSVIEALDGLPASKIHCSVLAEQTIHRAINNYRKAMSLEPWKDRYEEKHHHIEEEVE